jgi:hypothetical protein
MTNLKEFNAGMHHFRYSKNWQYLLLRLRRKSVGKH